MQLGSGGVWGSSINIVLIEDSTICPDDEAVFKSVLRRRPVPHSERYRNTSGHHIPRLLQYPELAVTAGSRTAYADCGTAPSPEWHRRSIGRSLNIHYVGRGTGNKKTYSTSSRLKISGLPVA